MAAQAYLDGDLPRYAALADHAPDFTLTPPYGGVPRHGFDGSEQAVERTASTFRGGDVDLEVHASYASDGLAVLVATERQHGTVGDLPRQEWSLRIRGDRARRARGPVRSGRLSSGARPTVPP